MVACPFKKKQVNIVCSSVLDGKIDNVIGRMILINPERKNVLLGGKKIHGQVFGKR